MLPVAFEPICDKTLSKSLQRQLIGLGAVRSAALYKAVARLY